MKCGVAYFKYGYDQNFLTNSSKVLVFQHPSDVAQFVIFIQVFLNMAHQRVLIKNAKEVHVITRSRKTEEDLSVFPNVPKA